ncbi:hypothetical protein L208DRAFT_1287068 [Tricholoma matsutake]|nr:hypothetical protein L208DRAFT_1287068 [Tricholoma matsutake 945]
MFSQTTFSVLLALFLAGQVFSSPLPMPFRHVLTADLPQLETIPIYVKRDAAELLLQKVYNVRASVIPAEIAVKAPDGVIVPYKRSVVPLSGRAIPAEIAVKAPDGIIVPYKRSVVPLSGRAIPAEIAVKAPDGIIVPYKRSVAPLSGRAIPAEIAVKAPDSIIVPY